MGRNLRAHRSDYSNAVLMFIAKSFWVKCRYSFSEKQNMPKIFCFLGFGWSEVKT